jgi:hypothetical protein
MKPTQGLQAWRIHLTIALLAGLILGACVGVYEGVSVLLSQELLGRYNELVAWSIAFDTSAIVAVEIGLSVLNAIVFTVMAFESVPHHLVALQLGESVFAAITAFGLWTQGTAQPHLLATSPISVIGPPGLVGILLGELVLVIIKSMLDRMPLLRRLTVRYWLVAEGVVVLGAVAFSFTH